jgi:type VI secretion system protein ImpK
MTENMAPAHHLPAPFIALGGLNPLVAAAMPLLLLLIKFKNTPTHDNVAELRRQVIGEISAFETRAKTAQCSSRLILAARYCLCTALDEAVLLTPWGSDSVWAQQSLLSIIQKETWGGERFFIILEKMAEEPRQNLSLLELLYLVLSLGFEGKYYNEEKTVREDIRHRLFRLIMLHREEPQLQLSPSLKILQEAQTAAPPLIPKWKIAAATAGLLFLLAVIFNVATYFSARKTLQELADIGQLAPTLITPAATSAPTKKLPGKTPPKPVHHKKHHRNNIYYRRYYQESAL